jgi:hypothetical protein
MSAVISAALYYNRRRRKANVILASLTPWASGLPVSSGQYVSSENGTSPWLATSSGTAGATAPSGQGAFNDGGVTWIRTDIQALLQYLFTGAPTP